MTRPEPKLKRGEREIVKRIARNLLRILKEEKLVLDWRKSQRTRAAVRVAIEEALDNLPTLILRISIT